MVAKVLNYMGVPIIRKDDEGDKLIKPSGCVELRVKILSEDPLQVESIGLKNSVDLHDVMAATYDVEGLPDPVEDTYYVVPSSVYFQLKAERQDLVVMKNALPLAAGGAILFEGFIRPM